MRSFCLHTSSLCNQTTLCTPQQTRQLILLAHPSLVHPTKACLTCRPLPTHSHCVRLNMITPERVGLGHIEGKAPVCARAASASAAGVAAGTAPAATGGSLGATWARLCGTAGAGEPPASDSAATLLGTDASGASFGTARGLVASAAGGPGPGTKRAGPLTTVPLTRVPGSTHRGAPAAAVGLPRSPRPVGTSRGLLRVPIPRTGVPPCVRNAPVAKRRWRRESAGAPPRPACACAAPAGLLAAVPSGAQPRGLCPVAPPRTRAAAARGLPAF